MDETPIAPEGSEPPVATGPGWLPLADEPASESASGPAAQPTAEDQPMGHAPATDRPRLPGWVLPVIGVALAVGIGVGIAVGIIIGHFTLNDSTEVTAAEAPTTTLTGATTTTIPGSTTAVSILDGAAYGTVSVVGDPLPLYGSAATDTAVGMQMPEISGQDAAGNPVVISNNGKAKVIVAIAHWCPVCAEEVPVVRDWYAATTLPDNVEVYSLAVFTDPTRANFPPGGYLQAQQWNLPLILDDEAGSAATALGAHAVPFWVLVLEDGTVAARGAGAPTTADLDQIVATVAAGPDTTTSTTGASTTSSSTTTTAP
jgi:cytochrome c biogenesis protein CcmG/thiol:disulfide interchange protein DsbE